MEEFDEPKFHGAYGIELSTHYLRGRCPECWEPHIFVEHGERFALMRCRNCGVRGNLGEEICPKCYSKDIYQTNEQRLKQMRCRKCEQVFHVATFELLGRAPDEEESCFKC